MDADIVHFGPGLAMDTTTPINTRGEMIDTSPVVFERGHNIVGKRTGGRSAPTTVNSSVRTREYLTTAEIERLMAAARKSGAQVCQSSRNCVAASAVVATA